MTSVLETHMPANVGEASTPVVPKCRNRNRSRFKPYGKNSNSAKSHEGVVKEVVSYGLPLKTFFMIECKLDGIVAIAQHTYLFLQKHDRRFDRTTRDRFVYVVKLAAFVRLYDVGVKCGYYNVFDFPNRDELVRSFSQVKFPSPISAYIESIGRVDVDNIVVVPFVPKLREYLDSPANFFHTLDEQGVETLIPCTIEDFELQYSIADYITDMNRAMISTPTFRVPNTTTVEGQLDMLVAYQPQVFLNYIKPSSFTYLDDTTLRRGGLFCFRNVDEFDEWNGEEHMFASRFVSEQYDSLALLTNMLMDSMSRH